MSNAPGAGSQGSQGSSNGHQGHWTPARIAITTALIPAIFALIGTLLSIAFSDGGKKDTPLPVSPTEPLASSTSPADVRTPPSPVLPDSVVSTPPENPSPSRPSGPPEVHPAKESWAGSVALPLELNQTSSEGAELDGENPGRLVGVDDDLRGDFSAAPGIVIMSGHAAESSKAFTDVDRAACAAKLPSPRDPGYKIPVNSQWVRLERGRTFCFMTTEQRVAAFSIADFEEPLPSAVTVNVKIWG